MRGNSVLPAPLVRQARLQLVERGTCGAHPIDERVSRSWGRSVAAGLSPIGRLSSADTLSGSSLQRARAENHELLSHSQPIMEYLFEQLRLSQSMVILADRHGVLMHTLGDLDFVGKAERVALMCGASWHEAQRGTNAIGTALAEAGDIEIHGAEHFLERNGFLTCAASPILSATGELMGILDISGDQRSRHPHTLGLVSTAARMIENNLLLASCRHQVLLHLHARVEGIGTVAQGVLALSEDGWLVGANRRALELLLRTAGDIGRTQVHHLFDLRMDELLAQARRPAGRPIRLQALDGQVYYAQVQARTSVQAPATRASAGAVDGAPRDALGRIDTGDARWRSAADKARRIAGKGIPLLLLGESGVGKELFAKAVHETSPRSAGPFVAINCAALPENLIEAELFGYAPGAFTGARKQGCPGRLREAQGGTLFLDEIGDMPLPLQTRLLRVLQERQVTPLGCGTAVAVDFALVCATNRNLRESVDQGRFRSDLFYRINGLTVQLPALRERSDFEALTRRLLGELAGEAGRAWLAGAGAGDDPAAGEDSALHLAPELLQALSRYRWPGNLRQYGNVLRTAVAMLEPGEACISWGHMPDDLLDELQLLGGMARAAPAAPPQNLHELAKAAIQQALENARGNVSAAARQLGISRQTLYRRLQEG